jgi:hypothetical protein
LLRPHAAEFHRVISEVDESKEGPYAESVMEYLQQHGVDRDFRLLLDAIRGGSTEEQKTQRFVQALREVGPDAFVALEATYGSWPERLRLFGRRVLRFTNFGPELRTMLNSPEVWRVYSAISAERSDGRPVNDLADAVALVTLHKLIEESKASPTLPEVRFHTNTPALLKVARANPGVKALLTYDLPEHFKVDRLWDSGTVLRSSQYFILRASFEALRFPDIELAEDNIAPPVTLLELERVLRELTEFLKPRGADSSQKNLTPEVLRQLDELKIGDRHLFDVIAEMGRSSFLERLFTRYRPPAVLKEMVSESPKVFEFMHSGRPREELRKEIVEEVDELKRELAQQLSGFYDRFQFIREIRIRVANLIDEAPRRHSDFVVTNPFRDLGIVRWGGHIREGDMQKANELFNDLFSTDQTRVMKACSEVERTVSAPLDESKCLAICSIFAVLSLWNRLILAINEYERFLGQGEIEPSLAILRTAARARVGPPFSEPEKTGHMDALIAKIQAADPKQQGRLYIGLAYTAFYIAVADNEVSKAEIGKAQVESIEAAPWGVRSYKYGERALNLLDADDRLGLAFATNHCAYVGVIMNLHAQKTSAYLDTLKAFETDRDVWHYRFADTIAVSEYYRAVAEWEAAQTAPDESKATKRRVCARLRRATEMLMSQLPRIGDPAITDHLQDVEKLRTFVECAAPEN